jgi:hypothetical protein
MILLQLKIKKGFYLRIYKVVFSYTIDNHRISFFVLLDKKSFGYVFYKVWYKFKWKKRKYSHDAIQNNIEEGYSMGGWVFDKDDD